MRSTIGESETDAPRSRSEDRPLFSLNLATMLTNVPSERLARWLRAGLLGRPIPHARPDRHPFSIRDFHTIDALGKAVEDELKGRVLELQAAHRANSDFIRLVGHEMRAPLAVVRGYVSLIQDGSMGRVPDPLWAVVPLIEAKLSEMDRLANQMLEVARIEDGRMLLETRRVDLRRVVSDAVQMVAPASSPGHELRVHRPRGVVPVIGDYSRLLTIVSNLLSNALKYSPAGGAIECKAALVGTRAQVSVRDNGLGISAEDKDRLFRRFERLLSDRTTGIAGTGLGLYLSRELARRHGGDITVESELGRGSTFVLDLPRAGARSAPEGLDLSSG